MTKSTVKRLHCRTCGAEIGSTAFARHERTCRGVPPSPSRSPRSGTSRSYEERQEAGRPNVTFCLPEETLGLIRRLAVEWGVSMSALVDLAVKKLDEGDAPEDTDLHVVLK